MYNHPVWLFRLNIIWHGALLNFRVGYWSFERAWASDCTLDAHMKLSVFALNRAKDNISSNSTKQKAMFLCAPRPLPQDDTDHTALQKFSFYWEAVMLRSGWLPTCLTSNTQPWNSSSFETQKPWVWLNATMSGFLTDSYSGFTHSGLFHMFGD